ncbi:MAG: hypothetical protein U9N40_06195 [Euryarchaeota archaeon]|nr:hypothetical protein [Euryarchaeota archaeon]
MKSRKFILALTGLAVLCVCAAMATSLATGDGTGRGGMIKDSKYQDGAWDDSQNITGGRGTATKNDDKSTAAKNPAGSDSDSQNITGGRGTTTKNDDKSTAAKNPAGSDSQSTPAPFFVVIPAACIGLILHLNKKK